jgi:hypothetical protein
MNARDILLELAEQSRKQSDLFDLLAESISTAEHAEQYNALPNTAPSLWALPDDARLTTAQLARAIARSIAYVHKAIDAKRTPNPLPYRKAGNRLLFVAGEVRPWLARQEVVVRGARKLAK